MSSSIWPAKACWGLKMNYWWSYRHWQGSLKIWGHKISWRYNEGCLNRRMNGRGRPISSTTLRNTTRATIMTTSYVGLFTKTITKKNMRMIIQLFRDFCDFLRVRRMNKSLELTWKDIAILRGYDKDFEKRINQILLWRLSQEMIDWSITPEIQRWAQLAMTWRIALLWNLKKDNITQ